MLHYGAKYVRVNGPLRYIHAMGIDGQVRLVHLKTDNFCLFLRNQMDKQQNSVCMMSKHLTD
jgi:hypothetical protein